jgi:acyl-homoserine-lactone acylase
VSRATAPVRRAISLSAAGALLLTLVPVAASAQSAPPTRGTELACPEPATSDFTDIAGSEHVEAIRCLADLGLTEGLRGGDRYGPRQSVRRDQMASFIDRMLEFGLGEPLPDAPDAFRDDDGSVHEGAIDRLTAIGVIEGRRGGGFDPAGAVTRGQMASFIARALDHLDDGRQNGSAPPATDTDRFADDDGSVHEDNIDRLAALGIVRGFNGGEYRPGQPVVRDQMAAFLVRSIDWAIEAGLIGDDVGDGRYDVTIRRTAFGVPHVEADDVPSLSYGMGYATSDDTICELMDRVITANGERSRYLGPGDAQANIISDLYHQRLIDEDRVYAPLDQEPGATPDSPSAEARDTVEAYAAGVARYLEETPTSELDPRCADEAWVKPFTAEEYWRVLATYIGAQQAPALVNAAPPGETAPTSSARLDPEVDPEEAGSNAYAFGSEVTGGGGVLLGNPHYPWQGPLRFYRAHLTVPGELNVVGAALINTPFVGIGHTDRVAWTHTVSTAQRYGFFELTLDPEDPTAYLYDGESVPMEELDVTIQVRQEDGELAPFDHTFYATPFGHLIEAVPSSLVWTDSTAYTFRTTIEHLRIVDQYLEMYAAGDVDELYDALGAYQGTTFNTTATDADGGTFFGDVGAIPHVTEELWAECATSPIAQGFRQQRQPLLDGSRSECQWGSDEDAVGPGLFGQAAVPHLFRDDHVSQMNDSHWLTNPAEPLEGLPRIFGEERTQRSLRTRLGLTQIEERLAGTDGLGAPGVDLEQVQGMLYANRVHGAELVRDDLVDLCRDEETVTVGGEEVDLTEACEVLADWDTRVDVDSEGAHLFALFVAEGGLRYADGFDPAEPVTTPNTLAVDDSRVLQSLGAAVQRVEAAGIALDAPWGSVHTEPRPGEDGEPERIAIHGGPGNAGVFNVMSPATPFQSEVGWSRIAAGGSWIMTVEFTEDGPVSEGVLTYSQSTDPTSPFSGDQTRLYSEKGWDPLLFDPADVRAETVTEIELRG